MKKFYLAFVLVFYAAHCFAQAYQDVAECAEDGKKFHKEQDIESAAATYLVCYKMDPKNADVLLTLGGLYLSLDSLNEAKKYFTLALKQMGKNSPYLAYTYSRLGDIEFKQGNSAAALTNYNRSLSYNSSNVNSIIGRGVILEQKGDLKTAARAYKTALRVEPYNIIARDNYRRLEPEILTDNEILEELKERKAISGEVQILTTPARALFMQIHRAEQNNGVGFVSEKYKGTPPKGFILEKNTGRPDIRLMLSLSGYNAFMSHMSLDAAKHFQTYGLTPADVYKLRDRRGEPVFDDKKVLTEEGISVYKQSLAGQKTFLTPKEPLPAAAQAQSQEEAALRLEGFDIEISNKEYVYVLKETKCSEQTLVKARVVKFILHPVSPRVFIGRPAQLEGAPEKIAVYNLVMNYRGNIKDKVPTHDNFFGSGAAQKVTLCNNQGDLAY